MGTVLVARCASLRPDLSRLHDPLQATKRALRVMARRIQMLDDQIADNDTSLKQFVMPGAATLTSKLAIGPGHAAQLLITARQNIHRLHSEAAFARLLRCRTDARPVWQDASHETASWRGPPSERRAPHDRRLPTAISPAHDRLRRTGASQKALSKKDVLRCLKRFIAREVYHDLTTDLGLPRLLWTVDGLRKSVNSRMRPEHPSLDGRSIS